MAKRINIVFPDMTTPGSRSRFIDLAVMHYVETGGWHKLREPS